jgi:hypothetical protein
MTHALPAFCDDVRIEVDVINITRFYLVVRNRATGIEHSFSYDHILIGACEAEGLLELVMPSWLAAMEGIDAF